MDSKSGLFLLVGVIAGFVAAGGALYNMAGFGQEASAANPKVLKLAHTLDQAHPVHVAMEFMAEKVAEKSHGALQVQVFPNGQLGTEPECIAQVQRGAIAMVKTSAATMEGFVPEMAVFTVPYLFRTEEHYWNVLYGEIGEEFLQMGAGQGLRGLTYYDSGARSFYTSKRPVETPADLRGLKVRVMQSDGAIAALNALGASPTPVPWGDLYTALQQGMVDGAENNVPSYFTSRHYEVAPHFSLDEHMRIPDLLLVSESIWTHLSEQERKWLHDAAMESLEFQRELWAEQTEANLEELESLGVKIYRPDQSAFAEAVQPYHERLKQGRLGEYMRRISEVE
ncbi:MAG: TRAP transporter substrate-binding protein [Verrucomicrobiota bacterium JB022]|nr:TRAP transporter substrate-binding protein [Verrucomicrobiota bacterium JB022]